MRSVIRRLSRVVFVVISGLLALSTILIILLAWRLSTGPMSLGILTPYLAAALTQILPSHRVELQDTDLMWDVEANRIVLNARAVTVQEPDGQTLAVLPTVEVGLSVPALLRSAVTVSTLRITGAECRLIRRANGEIQWGHGERLAKPVASGLSLNELSKWLAGWVDQMSAASHEALAHLHEVRVRGSTFTIDDQLLDATWETPPIDLKLTQPAPSGVPRLQLVINLPDAPLTIDVALSVDPETHRLKVETSFANFKPHTLAEVAPFLNHLAPYHMSLKGSVDVDIDRHEGLQEVRFELLSASGKVALPGVLPFPLTVQRLAARGRLKPAAGVLHLERATMELLTPQSLGVQLDLKARASGLGGDIVVRGQARLDRLPLADLQRYWPRKAAPQTRNWLATNIVAGVAEAVQTDFEIQLPIAPSSRVKLTRLEGSFAYRGAEVHYLRPLPPVTGVVGRTQFDPTGFHIKLTSGVTEGIQVTGGSVVIGGLDRARETIDIRVNLAGPIRNVLTLLDHPGLNLLAKKAIEPEATGGEMTAETEFAFSLRGKVQLKDVEIHARGNLREVSVEKVLLGQNVSDGELQLELDNAGMTLKGQAEFASIPVEVTWKEAFTQDSVWRTEMHVLATRVGDAGRRQLGLDLGNWVEGPVRAKAWARMGWHGQGLVEADLDLQTASLTIPFVRWRKPMGTSGKVQTTMQLEQDRPVALSPFTLKTSGLEMVGLATFNAAGNAIDRLALSQFSLGQTQLRDIVMRRRNGGFQITVGGGVLDAEPLMQRLTSVVSEADASEDQKREADAARMSLDIDVPALQRVDFGDGHYVENLHARLSLGDGAWERIEVKGTLPNATWRPPSTRIGEPEEAEKPWPQTFSLDYRPEARETLIVSSTNLGATLRSLNVFDDMIGGQLTLTGEAARLAAAAPSEMRIALEASSFTLKNAPVIARILSAASLPGLLNMLSSDGLKFTRLTATGELRPGKFSIEQLHTHGGSLGLTASGEIAYATGEIEIAGTIIPLYGVNSLLGHIPVINLLVGGKGQGVVAMNYGLTGPLKDPKVSVNPVSALTPGFLRRVFDLFKQERDEDAPSIEFRQAPNPPQTPPDSSDDGEGG